VSYGEALAVRLDEELPLACAAMLRLKNSVRAFDLQIRHFGNDEQHGLRVNSHNRVQFLRWAHGQLAEFFLAQNCFSGQDTKQNENSSKLHESLQITPYVLASIYGTL
jgi:hypothetical protein